MAFPTTETVLPYSLAPRHPLLRQGRKAGRPVNRSTLERWRLRGVRGPGGERVVLETALIGPGNRVTTVEALERFFAKLNGPAPAAERTPGRGWRPRTPAAAARQHEAAERELDAAGI